MVGHDSVQGNGNRLEKYVGAENPGVQACSPKIRHHRGHGWADNHHFNAGEEGADQQRSRNPAADMGADGCEDRAQESLRWRAARARQVGD